MSGSEHTEKETWQTLGPCLDGGIKSSHEFLIQIRQEFGTEDSDNFAVKYREILNQLEWLVPLVAEMQSRPSIQFLCPMLSI